MNVKKMRSKLKLKLKLEKKTQSIHLYLILHRVPLLFLYISSISNLPSLPWISSIILRRTLGLRSYPSIAFFFTTTAFTPFFLFDPSFSKTPFFFLLGLGILLLPAPRILISIKYSKSLVEESSSR